MFSWDISLQVRTVETDQARTSEVEVRFYAETPARTRGGESDTGTSTGTGHGWEAVTEGSTGRRAGRCTWTATPHC